MIFDPQTYSATPDRYRQQFVERAACRPSKFKDRAALAMTLVFKKSRRFIIVYYIGLYLIYGTVFFIRLLFRTKIMIILICESTPFTK